MKRIFLISLIVIFAGNLWTQTRLTKDITLKGSASAQLRFYSISKGKDTRPPFVFNVNAQPILTIGKWVVNTRFVIGNYQTRFRDFNRYGISPQYKWAKLYLGHSTLNWSQFALESRPILGVGFELTPGKWRLGAYAGRISRAAVQDTFNSRIFSPTYLRQMMAIKIGYGTATDFIDIVTLLASDKSGSLSTKQANGINPASNAVLGFKAGKQLIKNLSLNADMAFSAFTQNTNAKGEDLAKTTPAKVPGALIKTNSSSQFLGAYAAEIKYNKPGFNIGKTEWSNLGLSLDYSRVEPGYQSMGLYFLVSDIERIKAGLMMRSRNQKIQFNANAGYEHNDILNTQFFKNKRIIEGINIFYKPNNDFNLLASIQNYAVRLLADDISANDSLIINQSNRNYNLSGNLLLGDKSAAVNKRARIMSSVGYQSGKNVTPGTTIRNLQHIFFQASYSPASNGEQWRISPGYNLHKYTVFKTSSARHIPTVAFDRNFQDNHYQLHFETGLIMTWVSKKFAALGWRNSFSGLWNINKKNFLQGSVFIQPNRQKGPNIVEMQADLRYGVRF